MNDEFKKEEGKPTSQEGRKPTKSGKRDFRRKGTSGGVQKETKGIPTSNDWKFYAPTDQVAKDIASIPFNYMGGTPFPLEAQIDGVSNRKEAIPGVMAISYVNSIGVTDTKTDGVNMAAAQLYSYIRHANSGARNYEAADVMMYVLAMRDIYSQFFECKRALGLARLFNYYNHNLPEAILRALNIDDKDLRANLAQYRGRLNLIAEKINTFAVPKYFKVFERSAYISSYIFSDSSSIRGQIFCFRKAGYYKWSGTTSTSGTELIYTPENIGSVVTLDAKMDHLEEMLDAIFLDEDALTMSGDILKAFGETGCYVVSPTPFDYAVVPVFDEDILSQIENLVIFQPNGSLDPNTVTYSNFNVTQSNQLITWKPTFSYTHANSAANQTFNFERLPLNSHKDDPQYTDVLEWTRLMINFSVSKKEGDSSTEVGTLVTCGLELPISCAIYYYNFAGTLVSVDMPQKVVTAAGGSLDLLTFEAIAKATQFDWHPFIYVVRRPDPGSRYIHVVGDFKVATTIDVDTLNRINEAACYSVFYGNDLYNSATRK